MKVLPKFYWCIFATYRYNNKFLNINIQTYSCYCVKGQEKYYDQNILLLGEDYETIVFCKTYELFVKLKHGTDIKKSMRNGVPIMPAMATFWQQAQFCKG